MSGESLDGGGRPEPAPEKSGSSASGSGSSVGEARLIQGVFAQLSDDEKALRDREIVEQAERYFGGLSEKERALLNLRPEPGAPKPDGSQAEVLKPDLPQTNEWVWAFLSVSAFVGVLIWVIGGR